LKIKCPAFSLSFDGKRKHPLSFEPGALFFVDRRGYMTLAATFSSKLKEQSTKDKLSFAALKRVMYHRVLLRAHP
jgi:hypothetical protein